MKWESNNNRRVAIACGGTGGHLFPGLAVAEALRQRGHQVLLCVSSKELDRQIIDELHQWPEHAVLYLPAIGLSVRRLFASLSSYLSAYRTVLERFREFCPHAVLSMGGFTGAPVLLAGRRLHAITALHESNVIPGRANRMLSSRVHAAFLQFEEAAPRLRAPWVRTTGMPVRAVFENLPGAEECRKQLGLQADRPVLLVMGGSQGASGINDRFLAALPLLHSDAARFQILHLTGTRDFEKVSRVYEGYPGWATAHPFFHAMHLALGAATAVVSRAGASTIAECAAAGRASLLVPFPFATEDHQNANAIALERRNAARRMKQRDAVPERFAQEIRALLFDDEARQVLEQKVRRIHQPGAADRLADALLRLMECGSDSENEEREARPKVSSTDGSAGEPLSPHAEHNGNGANRKMRFAQ